MTNPGGPTGDALGGDATEGAQEYLVESSLRPLAGFVECRYVMDGREIWTNGVWFAPPEMVVAGAAISERPWQPRSSCDHRAGPDGRARRDPLWEILRGLPIRPAPVLRPNNRWESTRESALRKALESNSLVA